MIWLSVICSSLALAGTLAGATVSGKVELRDSREASVLVHRDYSGVVVSLTPVEHSTAPAPEHTKILQQHKAFLPHILAIPVGSVVDFPNLDPIFHNAFSNYSGQLFDVGLYPPGTSRSVKFVREGVVRIFCNIHSTMSAVVVVLPTPYFAVTASDGTYRISGVPAGEYNLRIFHERATAATLDNLSRHLSVGPAGAVNATIVISESGYLPIPHKNKYGGEYRAEPDEHGVYPGARK